MKIQEFEGYNKALENSTLFDLEELSKNIEYEERYMRFMRYVEILSENDQRKIEGKKLIDKIYDLEKFK